MTTFTVWKFEDADGATGAESALKAAESDQLVTVVDHAVLTWPEGDETPTLHHKHDGTKHGAAWGTLWGVLGGALFAIPVAGAAIGAGLGALSKASEGTSLREEDFARIKEQITPGTSALFMVTEGADFERVGERWRGRDARLLSTNLTEAERDVLLETFGSA